MTLRVLGLIPARAGSKGVPGKNERPLAGRGLVERARDAARDSAVIDRIVLSTDSETIAAAGRSLGLDVPFLRPPELADDRAPMLAVVEHALAELAREGYEPDAVALLQPTSPLRSGARIAEAVALLEETPRATAVVTVAPIPSHFAPHYAMRIEGGLLRPFLAEGAAVTRRQDVPAAYYRDGTLYLTRTATVVGDHDLYGAHCLPLVLRPDEVLTIDTPEDWRRAEQLLEAE
jgi:N-acylneuraminate cytidylyltransferase